MYTPFSHFGLAIILLVAFFVLPPSGQAANIAAGEAKAELCIRCHGHKGLTENPLLPNLAGQNEEYFIKQMHDFREKRRRSTPMQQISNALSDDEIENLAAYYRSLRK